MTHTPGPWEAIDNPDGIIGIVRHDIIDIVRRWDAKVTSNNAATFSSFLGAHIAEVPYTITGIPTKEQALANAALLAAAPELLQRLKETRDAIANLPDEAMGIAGDAIASWPFKLELLDHIDGTIAKAEPTH